MAFKLGPINLNAVAQGVGGLVFGKENGNSNYDGGVEQLLERISYGVLAEDRRAAITDLRDVVAAERAAQLALGAMGFPVLMEVLKEEREDLDMVRGALEVLLNGLSATFPGEDAAGSKGQEVAPGQVNAELFAREAGSVPLLLSLLEEEDFYVRYHTVQLLTVLLSTNPHRLQEAILSTPQGLARLMDMLQEREVIRNEALLLMISLTREAEEIQKIVVFEGAFERVLNIVREEGFSDGGIVVQDCLELLNNLLRNNPSNQVHLRETLGLSSVPLLLKVRKGGGDGPSRQKAANLLCGLETVSLLLARSPLPDAARESNLRANQSALAQCKLLDALLLVALHGAITSVVVRAQALRALGDLVMGHAANRELLGHAVVGEDAQVEPVLNRVLDVALRGRSPRECAAADHVLRCYLEGNPDGQNKVASSITPQPVSRGANRGETSSPSFGRALVQALVGSDRSQDLEASCRAASILAHVLRDNMTCKLHVLTTPLEIPASPLAQVESLLLRCMRWLAAAASAAADRASSAPLYGSSGGASSPTTGAWLPAVLLRLLIIWLADCPPAVAAFLHPAAHLPCLVELTVAADSPAGVHVAGLAAVLLGTCIVHNAAQGASSLDAATVVDIIERRIGLSKYFLCWENLRDSPLFASGCYSLGLPQPLTRATAAAVAAGSDGQKPSEGLAGGPKAPEDIQDPIAVNLFDSSFTAYVVGFEARVRQVVMELFARPRRRGEAGEVADLSRKSGETESDYAARLRTLLEKSMQELQEERSRSSSLVGELLVSPKGGERSASVKLAEQARAEQESDRSAADAIAVRGRIDALQQQVEEYQREAQEAAEERERLLSESLQLRQLIAKHEADLQALSEAYNSLEQDNFRLETVAQQAQEALSKSSDSLPAQATAQEVEAARQRGREEAEKENEAELNDLLVCLGQEESKVEKLRSRLEELGEDVGALLIDLADTGPPIGEEDIDFDALVADEEGGS